MPRPLAIRRHDEIVRRLRLAGSVGVGELAEAFGVSHETIRRDLKMLADQGHLDVVHGGAAQRGAREPALSQRVEENVAGKAAIGRAAAALVPEAGAVLIDAGTTTAAIVHELTMRPGLTICTNSMSHAATLCRVPGNRVFMLGGEIDGNDESVCGIDAVAALANFRVDIAFVATGGFAEDGGPADYTRVAAEMRSRMILAGRAYMLADHGKFARHPPFRIANFDRIAGLIVDRAAAPPLAAAWAALGVNVIIAE